MNVEVFRASFVEFMTDLGGVLDGSDNGLDFYVLLTVGVAVGAFARIVKILISALLSWANGGDSSA